MKIHSFTLQDREGLFFLCPYCYSLRKCKEGGIYTEKCVDKEYEVDTRNPLYTLIINFKALNNKVTCPCCGKDIYLLEKNKKEVLSSKWFPGNGRYLPCECCGAKITFINKSTISI